LGALQAAAADSAAAAPAPAITDPRGIIIDSFIECGLVPVPTSKHRRCALRKCTDLPLLPDCDVAPLTASSLVGRERVPDLVIDERTL